MRICVSDAAVKLTTLLEIVNEVCFESSPVTQFAFPDDEALPSQFPEVGKIPFIALAIRRNLGFPVFPVCSWDSGTALAVVTVPETAVHEHDLAT